MIHGIQADLKIWMWRVEAESEGLGQLMVGHFASVDHNSNPANKYEGGNKNNRKKSKQNRDTAIKSVTSSTVIKNHWKIVS